MSVPEALRTFHLTGKGLETLRPEGPLHPAGWPEPVPVESAYPCAARALPLMYGAAVDATRRSAREQLGRQARQMRQKMVDLLALDAAHADRSADDVAASMGVEANELLNTGALAVAVQKSAKGATTLPPDRRLRIEQAAGVLGKFVRQQEASPAFRLFHAGAEPPGLAAEGGLGVATADPVAAATAYCRQSLEDFGAVVRALKTARLEAGSAYEPSSHDERIARLDWRAADDEQLAGLPAVAALASAPGAVTPPSTQTVSRVSTEAAKLPAAWDRSETGKPPRAPASERSGAAERDVPSPSGQTSATTGAARSAASAKWAERSAWRERPLRATASAFSGAGIASWRRKGGFMRTRSARGHASAKASPVTTSGASGPGSSSASRSAAARAATGDSSMPRSERCAPARRASRAAAARSVPAPQAGSRTASPSSAAASFRSFRPASRSATAPATGGPPRRAAACARPKAARSRASGSGVKTAIERRRRIDGSPSTKTWPLWPPEANMR